MHIHNIRELSKRVAPALILPAYVAGAVASGLTLFLSLVALGGVIS